MFHGGRGPRRHTRGQPGRAPRVGGEAIKRSCRGPETTEVWSEAASGLTLARATVGPGDPRPKVARSDRNKTGVGSDPALCLSGDVGFDSCSGFREIMGGGGRLWGTAARELTGARCRCVPAHSGPSPTRSGILLISPATGTSHAPRAVGSRSLGTECRKLGSHGSRGG